MSKPSRAAQKRLVAQLNAEAAAAANTPPDPWQSSFLDSYVPLDVAPSTWAAIRGTHRDVMLAAHISNRDTFKNRNGELAHYLARRYDDGRSIAVADALTYQAIDEDSTRAADGLSDRSLSDRRSRLRKLAESANPGLQNLPRAASVGHVATKPPYSRSEEARIVRAAIRQRSPGARRNLCAAVGLCAGAGLDSSDLRYLTGGDVTDEGDEGIVVNVPGRKPRLVVVRRDYEELVRIGLDDIRPGGLALGKVASRRNIVGAVVENAELLDPRVPHIESNRLRNTWLCWALCQNVPLNVLLSAAGLKSARTLIELLPHLPEADTTHLVLRGAEVRSS
jgi:hypothetical protein